MPSGIVARKDQISIELMRAARSFSERAADQSLQAVLERISRKLSANATLLKRHIEAVGEIAAMISGVLSEASDDGTYSRVVTRKERSS